MFVCRCATDWCVCVDVFVCLCSLPVCVSSPEKNKFAAARAQEKAAAEQTETTKSSAGDAETSAGAEGTGEDGQQTSKETTPVT